MRFGKHKGCQFCIDNCHYHNYASSTFANEFLLNEVTIIPDHYQHQHLIIQVAQVED